MCRHLGCRALLGEELQPLELDRYITACAIFTPPVLILLCGWVPHFLFVLQLIRGSAEIFAHRPLGC